MVVGGGGGGGVLYMPCGVSILASHTLLNILYLAHQHHLMLAIEQVGEIFINLTPEILFVVYSLFPLSV